MNLKVQTPKNLKTTKFKDEGILFFLQALVTKEESTSSMINGGSRIQFQSKLGVILELDQEMFMYGDQKSLF